ncbi:MAG: TetR family transcriptional regulator C-terminal domain-containing protein [Acidobacteriota bacterium]
MPAKREPDQTRKSLLVAAFWEIYQKGYQAAAIDKILEETGVTKGALYHHFKNKKDLGLTVVDEIIGGIVLQPWLEACADASQPIEACAAAFRHHLNEHERYIIELGCPLNNLAQEMSPVDEDFRERINAVYRKWQAALAGLVARAQACGRVREGLDPERVASYIVSSFEGIIGMAKTTQSREFLDAGLEGLEAYALSLQPEPQS